MSACRGCGDERRLMYGLCDVCRCTHPWQRPLNRERHREKEYIAICNCGRDFLTLTIEEMSQPCPNPKYKEVRRNAPS